MFGSFLTEADRNFSAVNIICAVVRFNVRYAVATIEVIREKLRMNSGDISSFFTVQKNSEGGLAFVFATVKRCFGFCRIEGRVFPV